ncbi:MAG TPA: hypothetical protein VFM34_07095 [Moraxellaceae bacterium]|nr:hypothetical protein [Moraxellaceae bacterium]
MNARRWMVGALIAVAVVVVIAGRLLMGEGSPAEAAATSRPMTAAPQQLPVLPPSGTPVPTVPAGHDSPLPPVPVSTVDAADSMKEAYEHGDPSAPPVVRDTVGREPPTAAELADPKAYQRYEERQNQHLYNEYVKAADSEVPRLQADIERARAAGLPPEEIAKGEEKLRRIQAMKEQLQSTRAATAAP